MEDWESVVLIKMPLPTDLLFSFSVLGNMIGRQGPLFPGEWGGFLFLAGARINSLDVGIR